MRGRPLAVALLLGACSGNPSALDPAGPGAASIAGLTWLFVALCGGAFLATMAALAWAVARGLRRGGGQDPDAEPAPGAERRRTWIVGAAVGATALVLCVLVGGSYATDRSLLSLERGAAVEVKLTAHQWWWEIRYSDPVASKGFVTANELHLPLREPVRIALSSADVIHSLWVPNITGKRDIIPGRDNQIWLTATEPGEWRGRCSEFCGYQHAHMELLVVAEPRALERSWAGPPGLWGWLTSVDHKSIGRRYIVTAFGFLVLAGALAVVMRLQLASPGLRLVGPDLYNQIFTMHGSTMMFLFAVPMMEAVAVYVVPLMVGSRIIAFPRLNAFSYWVYLFGGIMLWTAFALNVGPDAGWFNYVPLSGPQYGAGKRSDYWAQLITFTEVSGLAVAVEIIVTVFCLRAPGMSLNRIPIFVWAMLVTSFCIVFALPSVVVGSSMIISDRLVGTHFFNPAEGGDPVLWQHLYWWFGHPEVYIIFLPATGMVSTIVETAARRPVFGYPAVVLSLISIGVLSFGLWVHHMFATGLPRLGNSFFTASSMAIAIPSGIQIFCWIATLWDGRVRVSTPILFVIGFVILFVLGGMTGLMVSSVPLDLQVTDTYFVVGHIHLVLLGGAVAPLLGAFYYWFPKFTGRMLNERAGRWNFLIYFLGVLLAFVPMLVLGVRGMTRRIYTYPEGIGWTELNRAATIGGVLIAASFVLFVLNVVAALRRPRTAPDNPWDASTLEWATASPPPSYNFAHIPWVTSRTPLWADRDGLPYVTGLQVDQKEILVTTGVDAEPDLRDPVPAPSIWPLIAAIATTAMLIGSIYTPSAVVWGAIPVGLALVAWLWPRRIEVPLPAREKVS